jgi:hypothetical protein
MLARPAILVVALVLCACAVERPAPQEPTWVDDVQPILEANCFHCHGASFDSKERRYRWDIYDLSDARYKDVGFMVLEETTPDSVSTVPLRTFLGASDAGHYPFILDYVSPEATEDTRMPPPPASRLSARDVAVLRNWSTQPRKFQPGNHQPNHPPAISWLDPGQSVLVSDADGDQVLGRLECGGQEVLLPRSGGHQLPPGAVAPCTGALFDGWDAVTPVELK